MRGRLLGLLTTLAAAAALAAPATASTVVLNVPRGANEVVYAFDAEGDNTHALVLEDLETSRRFVVLPGDRYDVASPELSPDGERIAVTVVDEVKETFRIAVVRRNGWDFRWITDPQVTDDSIADDFSPAWSPDGTQLLFTRFTFKFTDDGFDMDTALMVVPVAGGDATRVPGTAEAWGGDWDPSGRQVVFTAVGAEGQEWPLQITQLDGSGVRDLGVQGIAPTWSPDGGTIAFTQVVRRAATGAADTRVALTTPAGGATVPLPETQPQADWGVDRLSWSPDGHSVVFEAFRRDADGFRGVGSVWAVDVRTGRAGVVIERAGEETAPHIGGPDPAPVTAGGPSGFTPVDPVRVLDTRTGLGTATPGRVGNGSPLRLALRGLATSRGPVPADATAIVLNVTATAPTEGTHIRVFPSDHTPPLASNLNLGRGQTVPVLVTSPLGADGSVSLHNFAGQVHLVADLAGWYGPTGDGVDVRAPERLLDTRTGLGGRRGALGAGQFHDLQVTGAVTTISGTTTVPADATAVVLNLTGTLASASTDLRAYPVPADGSVPTVSNLNLARGTTAANLAVVRVGEGGRIRIRNSGGSAHVIADLAGWYSPSAPGLFVPVAPTRFLDTRSGLGTAPIPLTQQRHVDVPVAGFRGVPSGALGAVLSVTGTGATAGTDVRAYPAGDHQPPTTSALNLPPRGTRANAALVRIGSEGRVRLWNSTGRLDVIADLVGYVVPRTT